MERRQIGLGLLASLFSAACGSKPMQAKTAFSKPTSSSAAKGSAASGAVPEDSGLTGEEKKAALALSRLSFGARPGEVEKVAAMGTDKWIEAQLKPAAIKDTVAESAVGKLKASGKSIAELHQIFPNPMKAKKEAKAKGEPPPDKVMMDERPAEIALELASEKLLRAVYSERQLQEVLTDFWFNHFNVFAGKDQDRWAIGTYEREAIRPNIFGKFRDLLGATTHHPAMLVYLDNWRSVREGLPQKGGKPPRGPNENYARELLELHTLGVDGGYQQADVAEVAKAFTGWTIDQPQTLATFAFRPKQHDETAKTVLGRSIHGGGEKDGDAVLDLVAASPSTAHFLARKLAIRFVGDKPAEALVQKLAARFTATGGDLTAVYKTLFSADEFWDSGLAKVKTPFQLATSSIRALGGNYDGSPQLVHRLGKLGEPLYQCQPPTGYRDTAKAWVSAGTLVARMNFGTDLARNKIPGVSYDPAAVVANLPTDLLGLVAAAGKKVLGRGPTRTTESAITDGLQATLNKKGKARDADKQAESLVGLLLASPEFQKS